MTLKPAGAQREYLVELRHDLVHAAYRRRQQLAELPPARQHEPIVQTAHRESVRRILAAIDDALDRMDAGTYGECVGCGRLIALAELRRCAWTASCDTCARCTI